MSYEFITGIVVGVVVLLAIHNWQLSRRLDVQKQGIGDDLAGAIEKISQSHNSLVQSIAEIDRKASEAKLRIETAIADRNLLKMRI